MKIGNIISNTKINVGPEFNVLSDLKDITDDSIPTLIIGYASICEIHGKDNISVLDRKISDKLFWTFDKNAKRSLYNSDIEDFITYCYESVIAKKLKFFNFDLINHSQSRLMRLVKKVLSIDNGIAYESDNRVIYCYWENLTFIIDLNLFEYFGFDIIKIRDKIKTKTSTFLSGNEILIEYNNHLERLNNDIRLIPFLYSIHPHE